MDRHREIADAAELLNAWLGDLAALRPFCDGDKPEFSAAWVAAYAAAGQAAEAYAAKVTAHSAELARAAQMAALKAQAGMGP